MPVILRSTAELIAWMHGEYLSELLLRALKPKPRGRQPPSEVCFEWGLVVPDTTKLTMYGARATGVSRWSLDGEWDKNEVISFVPDASGVAPIVLHQDLPGRLALECVTLDVERLPDKRWRPPRRARADQFLVWGRRPTSWRELLSWIAPPDGVRLFERLPGGKRTRALAPDELIPIITSPFFGVFRLQRTAEDETPWLWLSWSLAITTVGHHVAIQRGTLADADWDRVRALPGHLGDCQVISGTVRCSGAEWVER